MEVEGWTQPTEVISIRTIPSQNTKQRRLSLRESLLVMPPPPTVPVRNKSGVNSKGQEAQSTQALGVPWSTVVPLEGVLSQLAWREWVDRPPPHRL